MRVLLVIFSLLAGAGAFTGAAPSDQQAKKAEGLAVQRSRSCSFERRRGVTYFLLDESEAAATTTIFTDRPTRSASTLPTVNFMATFDTLFASSKPNAALLVGKDSFIVEIDATVAPSGKFAYSLVQSDSQRRGGGDISTVELDIAFDDCAVFIDSFWDSVTHAAETVGGAVAGAASSTAGSVAKVATGVFNSGECIAKGNNVAGCLCNGMWNTVFAFMKGAACKTLLVDSVVEESECNAALDVETEGAGAILCVGINAAMGGFCSMAGDGIKTAAQALEKVAVGQNLQSYACDKISSLT